jgi:hypothetical protein
MRRGKNKRKPFFLEGKMLLQEGTIDDCPVEVV